MDMEEYNEALRPLMRLIDRSLQNFMDLKPILEAESKRFTLAEHEERTIALDFYNRSTFTVISLWKIFHPKNIEEFKYPDTYLKNGVAFFDFPSTLVLVRALFESYINMYYLLCENIDPTEKELRILLWNRHSINENLFLQRGILSTTDIKKLENNLEEIDTMIANNELFKSLKEKKENTYIGKCNCNKYEVKKITDITTQFNWSLFDTHTKAEKAGINRVKSEYFYKYFSNYAHSGALSVDMVNSIKSPAEARKQMILPIALTRIFFALTTNAFSNKMGGKIQELVTKDSILVEEINSAKEYITKEF